MAIDDEHFAFADQRSRVVRGHDGRHIETARDNGRVRRGATDVGQERAVVVILELNDVGGG